MERYIRGVLNITFILPMIAAWSLLIHKSYGKEFKKYFSKSSVANFQPLNVEHNLNFSDKMRDEGVSDSVKNKSDLSSVGDQVPSQGDVSLDGGVDSNIDANSDTISEASLPLDIISEQMAKVQNHLKQIAEFDKSKSSNSQKVENADLPKVLPLKNTDLITTQSGETIPSNEAAPDYDETLVEVSESAKNAKPMISKYVNTIFNKNIMRSFKVSGKKAVAFKADSLLANGPKGIVISKNNLKFLETSFARFKDLYGIAKVVVVTPEDHNQSYIQKISKFAKNYFAYELEVTTAYEFEDGFEIILIGEHR